MRMANMDHLASSNRKFSVSEEMAAVCFMSKDPYVPDNCKSGKLKVCHVKVNYNLHGFLRWLARFKDNYPIHESHRVRRINITNKKRNGLHNMR